MRKFMLELWNLVYLIFSEYVRDLAHFLFHQFTFSHACWLTLSENFRNLRYILWYWYYLACTIFVQKVRDLAQSLRKKLNKLAKGWPLDQRDLFSSTRNQNESIEFQRFSQVIKSLNQKSACIFDDIPMKIITSFQWILRSYLQFFIINTIFQGGIYPNIWKRVDNPHTQNLPYSKHIKIKTNLWTIEMWKNYRHTSGRFDIFWCK